MKSLKGSINYPLKLNKPADEYIFFEVEPGSEGFTLTLSGREKPATSEEGRYSLAFEGEIYNWRTLKGILIDLECDLTRASVSEILLAAFLQWDLGDYTSLSD